MSEYLGLPSSHDMWRLGIGMEALEPEETLIVCTDVGQFPTPTEKAVTSDSSVLMAVGSANATGRRSLKITNVGKGVALVSGVATGGGIRFLPGQSKRWEFALGSDGTPVDVSVYARAETSATTILIEEH